MKTKLKEIINGIIDSAQSLKESVGSFTVWYIKELKWGRKKLSIFTQRTA
jgi:hypothetical protein